MGEAMETPSAISVAVRKEANFMGGLLTLVRNRAREMSPCTYKENVV
jgi:hypothetical protein